MKRKNFTKSIFIVLLVVILLLQLVSCNNKRDIEKLVIDHVYKRTEIALPSILENPISMYMYNDRVHIIGSGYSQKQEATIYMNYSVNKDGTDPREEILNLDFIKLEGYEGSYISNIMSISNGKLLAIVEAWGADKITGEYKSDNYFMIIDDRGNVEQEINIKEILKNQIKNDYFYVGAILIDDENNLYLSSDQTIFVLDKNYKFSFKIELGENTWINKLFNFSEGKIAAALNSEGKEGSETKIRVIDPKTKGFAEEIVVNDHLQNNVYTLFTGENNSIYYSTQSGIYNYDAKQNTSKELLNWINSDIETPGTSFMVALSDEKFICVSSEYDQTTWTSKSYLLLLDHIPPEQVVPKYLITLATAYGTYEIKKAVIAFNRSSQEYRIQIRDYAEQQDVVDYNDIIEKLNNDIVAGNMPDILMVTSEMPFDSYVSKGLFYDLNKLIDKDDSFNKEDYFTNVFEAMSVKGKLYSITPSFVVNTVAIKTKFVEPNSTGWTMGQMKALLAKLPKDTETFLGENRENVMNITMRLSLGQFINKDTGQCTFDSEDFKDILKFVKTFDEKSFWDTIDYDNIPPDFWDKYNKSYEEDRAILSYTTFGNFYQFSEIRNYTFKEDFTFIGFPNSDKNGSAIWANNRIAISAKSKLVDGAWSFVKEFLSDDYQNNLNYEWPIKISSFDEMGQRAIEGIDQGGIIGPYRKDNFYDIMPYPNEDYKITKEEVQYIKTFLQSVNRLEVNEPGVLEIINDETKMYYAGNKTAEETAKVIQSRVYIYISEAR